MKRPGARFPVMTLALVASILGVYGLELKAGGEAFCEAHGLIPERFMWTGDLGPVFTHAFLHDPAAPLAHLGGNVLALLACGLVVEPVLGSACFLALYVAAGILGALLHVAVDPHSSVALVGASACIAGVLAVLGVIRPRLIGFAVGFIGWNVWLAWSGTAGNVSFAAHCGGAFVGAAVVVLTRLRGVDLSRTVAA